MAEMKIGQSEKVWMIVLLDSEPPEVKITDWGRASISCAISARASFISDLAS